jgi:hypothetical protein
MRRRLVSATLNAARGQCARKDTFTLLVQLLFPSFPIGAPGIALLLLRATVAFTLLIRGSACLPEAADRPVVYISSLVALLGGGLLSVGFLTPIAATGGGIVVILAAAKILPGCASSLFDSGLGLTFGVAILLALVILGPGAYSIDARLFGRREIIIPRANSRQT